MRETPKEIDPIARLIEVVPDFAVITGFLAGGVPNFNHQSRCLLTRRRTKWTLIHLLACLPPPA